MTLFTASFIDFFSQCVLDYLPGATDALKEIWHPHWQHHRLSQQLLGVFQVSDVRPAVSSSTGLSQRKQTPSKLSMYINPPAPYQCTLGLRDTMSLSSDSTRLMLSPAPLNFFCSVLPTPSPAPLLAWCEIARTNRWICADLPPLKSPTFPLFEPLVAKFLWNNAVCDL